MIKVKFQKITKKEFIDKMLNAIEDNKENTLDDKTFISYAKFLYKAYKFGCKVYYREPHKI